jgi:hypothetical protein
VGGEDQAASDDEGAAVGGPVEWVRRGTPAAPGLGGVGLVGEVAEAEQVAGAVVAAAACPRQRVWVVDQDGGDERGGCLGRGAAGEEVPQPGAADLLGGPPGVVVGADPPPLCLLLV